MPTTVAVVGGGPLGLMALKNFLEDGFDATLFEGRDYTGGIWKPSDDKNTSVVEDTVFNSSKFRCAATDFPVPESMDNYPTGPQMYQYWQDYCEHFKLWPHIQLNSRALTCTRVNAHWELGVGKDKASARSVSFDKVVFSCGSFVRPRQPKFEGSEKFAGEALHTMDYHGPARFKDKTVLLIGLHASAQDVVSGLSKHAKQVYISHRSGVCLVPNYTPDGSVTDRQPALGPYIALLSLSALFPSLFSWILDTFLRRVSKQGFPNIPESWGFKETRSSLVAVPLFNSTLYKHLESGFARPVPEVSRIWGPKNVQLKSGENLNDVDAIIFCTGYDTCIPVSFEPAEIDPYPHPGAVPKLFRNVFSLHPDPAIRESIAFLGQVGIPFPGFSQHEAVAMSVSQVWQGNSTLPALSEMQQWQRNHVRWRENTARKFGVSDTFYPLFVQNAEHAVWLDETAGLGIKKRFGLIERWTNPATWSLWWNDRKLYNQVLTGLTSPAIFRIFDEGKRKTWAGAREQIFLDDETVIRAAKVKKLAMEKEKEKEKKV